MAKHSTITSAMLDVANINPGENVVLYDKRTRRAYFFKRTTTGYTLVLVRDKRSKPITVRDNDALLSVDFDGSVAVGDAFGVFSVIRLGNE